MENTEILVKVIKQQAEVFLLDAGEFFPFGTCIGKDNAIIPIAACIEDENDRPESEPLIEMLENNIKSGLANEHFIIGALAYDVFLHENQEKFDAIVICIYENDNFVKTHFKYSIHESHVEFS
ncbi:hypothetical protein ACPPVU_06840 [Mucilaginibacter sp. McL0603]|uniref:hypothetical protein n=1 Tax=Mucilaginibacter sp. McL0603 TaxID=3415670 RepID=UPI003CF4EF82